jgi:alkanesulfonate monooxygenase SsuD/methylene tetrahydromethanopterin reductase-like flavin-dependent oxidoreductase (luciferase family)
LYNALQVYREQFTPSNHLQQPYALACVNVVAAETDAEAQHLATSLQMLVLGLIRNKRRPLQPPVASMDGVWLEAEKAAVQQFMTFSFIGSSATVQQSLQAFLDKTAVDEIMVTSHIYDQDARQRSYEIIATFFKQVQNP